MERNLICISCPLGCRLAVNIGSADEIAVSGNRCKRGENYAREEIRDPKRTVTAVVRTDSPSHRYLPVRTDQPLSKKHINALLNELYRLTIPEPVEIGQLVIQNFRETGVNVIATRNLPVEK